MTVLPQRALAGAARAPQQRVVGRHALGEAPGVPVERLGLAGDALQQREIDPIYLMNRLQPVALRMPDEGVGSVEGDGRRSGRGESLQSLRDALENGEEVEAGGAFPLCSKQPAPKGCFCGEDHFAWNRGFSPRTGTRAGRPLAMN